MARVRLSKLAEDDLVEIWYRVQRHVNGHSLNQFIADDNPSAATDTIELIESKFHLLAKQPEIGHNRPDLMARLQSFAVGSYIIFFLASKRPKGVDIVRVLEGHRDIASEEFGQI